MVSRLTQLTAMITEIIFMGLIPGNNGKNGLLRMHHTKRTKLKKNYLWIAKASKKIAHPGPVRLELIRYTTGNIPLDFDNLVSTGKDLCDSIVHAGIIPDDKPAIIRERDYSQVKVMKQEQQMTVIRIIDLPQTDTT